MTLVAGFFPAFERNKHGTTHHKHVCVASPNVSTSQKLPSCQGQTLTLIGSTGRHYTWYIEVERVMKHAIPSPPFKLLPEPSKSTERTGNYMEKAKDRE